MDVFAALERRCLRVRAGPIFPDILDENQLVDALENVATLSGHGGCVNTLRWNKAGTLLASGSDDRQVKVWRAGREQHSMETGHEGNVFAVEFLPDSDDRKMVTGAADRVVFLHDLESGSKRRWECGGRIKRICTVGEEPSLFWAASESDKRVLQFDTRTSNPEHVVAPGPTNPRNKCVKSVAISEARPNLIVVGFEETAVRLYDRRRFDEPVVCFSPTYATENVYHATHVAFNRTGTEVVVNHGGGGGVFVFSVDPSQDPHFMERFHAVLRLPKEPVITAQSLPHADLREVGSTAIRERHFTQAVDYYSDLMLRRVEDRAFRSVCFSNRATALLLRRSRGDTYACVRDCVTALEIHRGNSKALFRLIKSFNTMEKTALAKKSVETFKKWFANDQSIAKMEEEINLLREDDDEEDQVHEDCPVVDYQQRFAGCTNHQTDIKEANFLGSRDQFIVAGSDCGHMYIWSRETSKIVGVWHADDHILNIVQPHPEQLLIASSGIDDDIRLWAPLLEKEEGFESRQVADPYEFIEKKNDLGPGMHLHVLRDFMRDSPQCTQS